jgi:NAD(P)-dependent dehydrogenase (short-subunit alcohol dehydrogenase family)
MKYAIPWLLESGGGSIVNVASAAGLVGAATLAGYCSAKGGVIQLGRVAAIDYAQQGIRVNTVCPGLTDTPMLRRELARRPAGAAGLSSLGNLDNLVNRVCDPHEIAEGILFAASDRSSFMIGSELVIDGGKLTR